MENTRSKSFATLVKIILDILFVICFVSLIASPLIMNKVIYYYTSYKYNSLFNSIFALLVISDIVVLYVLYELRCIFKSIKQGTPFIENNVKSLFRMGIASCTLSLVFIFKLFVIKSFLTYFVILVLIIAGCFSFTLSELFKEAMKVKEENDLTI